MKLYKNNACINMSLDEFLEFLEEEALDDVLHLLNKLDEEGAMYADFDGDVAYLDGGENLESIFAGMSDEDFYMETMNEDVFNMIAGASPELLDELLLSNEDIKVREIVKAFSYIEHPEK